jgi:hypothetical protein
MSSSGGTGWPQAPAFSSRLFLKSFSFVFWYLLISFFGVGLWVKQANAALMNVTFDDSSMGDVHGAGPISYQPAGVWKDQAHCTGDWLSKH